MPSRRTKSTKKSSKKAAPADPLFPARARSFTIGGDVRPKRDLTRFVRWPKNVRLQRQRKVLTTRLKVPPALNQFNRALDKNQAAEVFKLLAKYTPETRAEKKARLSATAAAGGKGKGDAPIVVKFGLKHVTTLVEQKKAQLVCIASDVDPIELVVWLPALCRKMDVPYVIVKNKGRLGTIVNQKSCAVTAITKVKPADAGKLERLQELARSQFNDAVDMQRTWGGGIMGLKTQTMLAKREAARQAELQKKMKL